MTIQLYGLMKSFRSPSGLVHVVRGVDIFIAFGEIVALFGFNGVGKSTMIDLLLGLLFFDAGTVSFFDMTFADAVKAGAVGVMLQVGAVIQDLSVRELITMMASLYPKPLLVDDVVVIVGIGDFIGCKITCLFGGQTQRLRFVVALVSNFDLFVFDELISVMDVEFCCEFWVTMRRFVAGGKTVLFAIYYLEEADVYADWVVVMARGCVVADGLSSEIKVVVGTRTIRVIVLGVDIGALAVLFGVVDASVRGETVLLTCSDSDAALRVLLSGSFDVCDIEVSGVGLEEVFVRLTSEVVS